MRMEPGWFPNRRKPGKPLASAVRPGNIQRRETMGSFDSKGSAANSFKYWRERQRRALDAPYSESADAELVTGRRRYVSGLTTPNIPDAWRKLDQPTTKG